MSNIFLDGLEEKKKIDAENFEEHLFMLLENVEQQKENVERTRLQTVGIIKQHHETTEVLKKVIQRIEQLAADDVAQLYKAQLEDKKQEAQRIHDMLKSAIENGILSTYSQEVLSVRSKQLEHDLNRLERFFKRNQMYFDNFESQFEKNAQKVIDRTYSNVIDVTKRLEKLTGHVVWYIAPITAVLVAIFIACFVWYIVPSKSEIVQARQTLNSYVDAHDNLRYAKFRHDTETKITRIRVRDCQRDLSSRAGATSWCVIE